MLKMVRLRMAAAIILAVITAVLTYIYLRKDYVTVVIAAKDIPPYTPITGDMLEEKPIRRELTEILRGCVRNKAEVTGWVSSIRVGQGYPIIKKPDYFYPPKAEEGYLPYNYCVVGIRLDGNTAGIKKGNFIDLYMVMPDENGRIMMPNLRVLSNELPPTDLRLSDGQNGYVLRDVILYDVSSPDDLLADGINASIVVNRNYQDLIVCGKNSGARLDVVAKGYKS